MDKTEMHTWTVLLQQNLQGKQDCSSPLLSFVNGVGEKIGWDQPVSLDALDCSQSFFFKGEESRTSPNISQFVMLCASS